MRARFWINSVKRLVSSSQNGEPLFYGEVELVAVNRTTDDNVQWAHYTPVGKLTMTVGPDALEWYMNNQGKDVYLDLSVVVD